MSALRRSLPALSLAAVLVTLAPAALAQEDPRKAQSTPLFEEGLRLADKGRQADALEKFRKAYEVYPSPNTLFNIARAEQLVGRRPAALGHFREALKNPLLLPQNATRAKQYVTELEAGLGRVMVNGPAGTKVSVAGAPEVRLPMNEPIDVEPGMVGVKIDGDGVVYETTTTAVAGQLATVDLKSKTADPPAPVARPVPPVEPPVEEPATGWSTPHIVTTAALGAGAVAGLVLGFVFHGKANDAADQSRAVLAPVGGSCNGVTSAECDRAASLESDHDRNQTLSAVSFVGAGVLGAAAIATVFLWPSGARSTRGTVTTPRLTPRVTTTALGADFALSF